MKQLFELGIAEEVVKDNYKRIRPYSVGVMHHGLDEKMLQMQRLKRDLELLEKAIRVSVPEIADSTTIRYYKNRSGARQLYWNTLKAKNTVYVYSDWGRARYVGMRFYERFVAESRQRDIQEKVLINASPETIESIRQFTYPGSPMFRTRLKDIRILNKEQVNIKGDTLIYDDVYAQIYLKNVEINGFEVESSLFVATQRSIFETLWKLAAPAQDFVG